MASSSASSCPGVRWNIISTDGAPNVQLPSLRMLMAGRVMRAAALRCRRLMAAMSLYCRKLMMRSHSPSRLSRSAFGSSGCASIPASSSARSSSIFGICCQVNIRRISTSSVSGCA